MNGQYRQGDVLLKKVPMHGVGPLERLPARAGGVVLARGEATGHTHAIAAPGAELYRGKDGKTYLRLAGVATLEHEEHAPIALEEGFYEVVRQRSIRQERSVVSGTKSLTQSAAEILARARSVEAEHPRLDRERAEGAIESHFAALAGWRSPVVWAADPAGANGRLRSLRARRLNGAWYGEEREIYRRVYACLAKTGSASARAWEAVSRAALRLPHAIAHLPLFTMERAAGAPPRLYYVWWGVRLLAQAESLPAIRAKVPARYLKCLRPMLDLYEAGVWAFAAGDGEIIAVSAPGLSIRRGRLHAEDGPAVRWRSGAERYFWRGVEVPEHVILRPQSLRARKVLDEPNLEVRRIMIERIGFERLVAELGLEPLHEDEFGRLYWVVPPTDEPIALVEVVNSTPERDGSFRRYLLRVPPGATTAREAVAWTFGMTPDEYGPSIAS